MVGRKISVFVTLFQSYNKFIFRKKIHVLVSFTESRNPRFRTRLALQSYWVGRQKRCWIKFPVHTAAHLLRHRQRQRYCGFVREPTRRLFKYTRRYVVTWCRVSLFHCTRTCCISSRSAAIQARRQTYDKVNAEFMTMRSFIFLKAKERGERERKVVSQKEHKQRHWVNTLSNSIYSA